MSTEFSTFPLKNSCRNQLSQYCGANNFEYLVERFFPYNSTARCGIMLSCENVTETSPEIDRLNCGNIFSSTFLSESLRTSFTGLTYPCNARNSSDGSLLQTSFIETKSLLKARQVISANSSSTSLNGTNTTSNISVKYIDISGLSSAQQAQLNNIKNAVVSQTNIPVSVDSNSDFMMNSNVESDLTKINSNVLASDYFSSSVGVKITYTFIILISFIILF